MTGSAAIARLGACLLVLAGCAQMRVAPAAPLALGPTDLEGSAHGFPALRSLDGETLADGEFTQWIEDERLHIRIRYDFGDGHSIEERSVLRQRPELVQERWSWSEVRGGRTQRSFAVDFLTGSATAEKLEDGETRTWSKDLDFTPGRAFAGSAFTLAIKSVRARLLDGETVELETVAFTPKPRAAVVQLSHAGLEGVPMAGRTIAGDHFVVHPKVPAIAKLFVEAPDTQLWLVSAEPAAFLRMEGPLGEPDDPIVRVDLLPGEPSAPATTIGDADPR